MSKILLPNGNNVIIDYCRSEGMNPPPNCICVFCKRWTNRFTIARLDGGIWDGIACCDECHNNLRQIPANDKIQIERLTT